MKQTKKMKWLFRLIYLKFQRILFFTITILWSKWKRSKNFLNKFYSFTNETFKLIMRWKTRNWKFLFPLKDKDYILYARSIKVFVLVNQPISVKRHAMYRLDFRSTVIPVGRSSKHLNQNISRIFTWSVICSAPKSGRTPKKLKRFM